MNFKTIFLITALLWGKLNLANTQAYGYYAFSSCISQGNSCFAALNNPAELINAKTTLSYSISNPYGVKDLYAVGMNLQSSTSHFGAGISWQNEGNQAYHFNKIGLSTALKPSKDISVGLKGHFEFMSITKYALRKRCNIDLSISVVPNSKIKTSFLVKNLIHFKTNTGNEFNHNQTIVWGLAYNIEKRIKLLLEIEKSKLIPIQLKAALSVQKDSIFNINICSSNAGRQLGLGIGMKKKKVELGFAFAAHIVLGFSTCLSLAYEIKS